MLTPWKVLFFEQEWKIKKSQADQSLRLFFRAFGTFRLPKLVCNKYTKVIEISCQPINNWTMNQVKLC